MRVDPHLLRTFVTVARCGSFSVAARELRYTQSAVSQHIAALENDLGAALLNRRPVEPTAAGERLLEHAAPLLLRIEAARADVTRITATAGGRLRLVASPLALSPRVAAALAGLPAGTDLTVQVLNRSAAVAAVATGAADLCLVDGMAAPSDPLHLADVGPLVTVAVDEQPLAVALPAGHPLAGRRGLRLTDLVDARWIDAPDAAVDLVQLRAVAGTDAFRIALRYDGVDVRGLLMLVAAGQGIAILPSAAVGDAGVELVAPRLVHRVELVHGAGLQGPAAALAVAL